ncbi:MAG: hypothetical protein ACRC2N_09395 [Aeromonas sp.]
MKHLIYLSLIACLLVIGYEQQTQIAVNKMLLQEASERITSLETNKSELMGMLK